MNQNEELISVIIPVYNVDSYIRRCLDSVANQTHKNLEIICIDDGSSDCSGVICDEYASRDRRFIVKHKKNEGYPVAINEGLAILSGDYVGFIDPDDWIELDFYENALTQIKKCNADVVCFNFFIDSEFDSRIPINKNSIHAGHIEPNQVLTYAFARDVYPGFGAYLWNKLYKSAVFNSPNIFGCSLRMDNELMAGCDVLAFAKIALFANCIIYNPNSYYHYYQRNDSLIHCKDLSKRECMLQAYCKIISLLEKNEISESVVIWVKRFYAYHASCLAEIAYENGDAPRLRQYKHAINRYLEEYRLTNEQYPNRMQRIRRIMSLEF